MDKREINSYKMFAQMCRVVAFTDTDVIFPSTRSWTQPRKFCLLYGVGKSQHAGTGMNRDAKLGCDLEGRSFPIVIMSHYNNVGARFMAPSGQDLAG